MSASVGKLREEARQTACRAANLASETPNTSFLLTSPARKHSLLHKFVELPYIMKYKMLSYIDLLFLQSQNSAARYFRDGR
jgi:hypothetical protein